MYLTADSTVSAFWASSVQCWCLGWGLSLKSHPKCPTHVVHLSHAMYLFPFVFVTAHSYFRRVLLSGGSLALQGQRRHYILLWKGEEVSFIPLMFFFNPFQTGLFRFVLFFVWHYVNARVSLFVGPLLLGTLRNYDGDGNGNFKK